MLVYSIRPVCNPNRLRRTIPPTPQESSPTIPRMGLTHAVRAITMQPAERGCGGSASERLAERLELAAQLAEFGPERGAFLPQRAEVLLQFRDPAIVCGGARNRRR